MMARFKNALFCMFLVSPVQAISEDLSDLSLVDLLNIEVSSVSKQSQSLSNAPAAVYVISSEDIQRSGATSIPQALRDVPGLHVVQIDSQKWAVSSRGFNGRYNNKLLVMIDGRTLYAPEFSGVYWEVQDILMADIDRIEIIRGPSAAMWGANAVNGAINITTKHSADTLGGYAELGVGNYEQGFAGFRYGGEVAVGVTARGYAKGFKRDSLQHYGQDMDANLHMLMMGLDTDNDWRQSQVGARIDINFDSTAALRLSTDIYDSKMQQVVQVASSSAPSYREFFHDSFDSRGWNVLAKYTKALSATSEYSFQSYYDYTRREEDLFGFTTDTVDFDFQHQFTAWQKHDFIWGLGYRYIKDDINTHPVISSSEDSSSQTNLWSAFISDEITLLNDQLWLTLASRFEHNSYTGLEVQPNIRLMWQLNDHHKLWSSIAYSVRAPNRAENNLKVNVVNRPSGPTFTEISVRGNDAFESEELLSYEIGYRFTPSNKLSFDTALFYNDYDKLRGIVMGTPDMMSGFPFTLEAPFVNNQDGQNYGFELSSQWVPNEALRFKLNYSYIYSDFSLTTPTQNTDAPENIVSAHADWNISNTLNLNLTWRYVDAAPVLSTFSAAQKELDSYQGLDIGLIWQLTPDLTLAAYGKNLLYPSHVEFEAEQFHIPYRVEPTYYGKITVQF